MKTKLNVMKIKMRLISIIGSKLDLDLFYSIRYDQQCITMQGYMTTEVIHFLSNIEFPLTYIEDAKWLEGSKGCIRIVLTPKSW